MVIPPMGSLIGQRFIGWNSDRVPDRRWHASLPIIFGAVALAVTPEPTARVAHHRLFTLAMTGLKAYLPAFWRCPACS